MSLHVWFLFVGSSAVLLALPGPTAFVVMGCARDRRSTAFVGIIAGAVAGDMVAMTLCNVGLTAVVAMSATAFAILRGAAAVYLFVLGGWAILQSLRPDPGPLRRRPAAGRSDAAAAFTKVLLVTALNPKGIAFFAAFLPQFIDGRSDVILQCITMQITFAFLSCAAAACWTVTGLRLHGLMRDSRVVLRAKRVGGLFLICAGITEALGVRR